MENSGFLKINDVETVPTSSEGILCRKRAKQEPAMRSYEKLLDDFAYWLIWFVIGAAAVVKTISFFAKKAS